MSFQNIILALAVTAVCVPGAGNIRAADNEIVTLNLVAIFQAGPTNVNGTNQGYAESKQKIDNSWMFGRVEAVTGANIPANAQLGLSNGILGAFINKSNFMAFPSNQISYGTGVNITSGVESGATGLADPRLKYQQFKSANYDDTSFTTNDPTRWMVIGLETSTISDTVPNRSTGNYVQKEKTTVLNVSGQIWEGTNYGFVTGEISFVGGGIGNVSEGFPTGP